MANQSHGPAIESSAGTRSSSLNGHTWIRLGWNLCCKSTGRMVGVHKNWPPSKNYASVFSTSSAPWDRIIREIWTLRRTKSAFLTRSMPTCTSCGSKTLPLANFLKSQNLNLSDSYFSAIFIKILLGPIFLFFRKSSWNHNLNRKKKRKKKLVRFVRFYTEKDYVASLTQVWY